MKRKLLRVINDFFQYRKKGDDELLLETLENIEVNNNNVKIGDETLKIERKRDMIGIFLANIPYFFLGKGELHYDLPEKVLKAQGYALRLLSCSINDLATLETYLILEMGLRSMYSEWIGDKVILRYGKHKVNVRGLDYRRLKLYIRRKGWSKYKVRVKGEVFPFSQGMLLDWAEKFIDERMSLALRLSMNVRNLLAHGELEWNLYPTMSNVASSSQLVWNLFSRLREK